MKTNSTLVVVIRIVAFILLCLYSFLVFGQAGNTSISGVSPLQKFSAVVNEKNIQLQWTLAPDNNASSITVEKGFSTGEFQALAEYWVNMEGNYEANYKWSDVIKGKRSLYYRLKITDANGKILYSNTLHFAGQKPGNKLPEIYSSSPQSTVTTKQSSGKQEESLEKIYSEE